MIMAYVEPDESFEAESNGSSEASFEGEESDVAVVQSEKSFDPEPDDADESELMQVKLQLFQKQQEVDALKREIDAQRREIEEQKLQNQVLRAQHNVAICELQQELRLGFVDKIKEIMALYARV